MKIKASLSVIVGDDEELLSKIKSFYLQNATIKINECCEEDTSEIMKFLNRDERQEIRSQMIKDIKNKFIKTMRQSIIS